MTDRYPWSLHHHRKRTANDYKQVQYQRLKRYCGESSILGDGIASESVGVSSQIVRVPSAKYMANRSIEVDMRNLTVGEVAKMFGVTSRAISTWRTDNDMPFKKSKTGRITFDVTDIRDWYLIRELKKLNIYTPIPVTTTITEIKAHIKEKGMAFKIVRIEYDKNGEEVT